MTDKGIAERIKIRRQELGMTQDELATLLNYKSRSSIYKIEIGENDIPHSKIAEFARALETTPSYLMGWEPNEPSSSDGVSYRIRTIMKYRKLSLSQLADKLSVPESELYSYIYLTPDSEFDDNDDRLFAIAEALGVKHNTFWGYCTFGDDELENYVNFLLDKIQRNLPLTEKESTILSNYINGISTDNDMIDFPDNIIPLPKTKMVPLVGTIACGTPILAEENVESMVPMPDHIHADFALRCKGDSMINARILDNDIVYIRKQETVENGEIAAVLIDNEATLKRFYRYGDTVVLRAENPSCKEFEYKNEEINDLRILGKAVYFLSSVQ